MPQIKLSESNFTVTPQSQIRWRKGGHYRMKVRCWLICE